MDKSRNSSKSRSKPKVWRCIKGTGTCLKKGCWKLSGATAVTAGAAAKQLWGCIPEFAPNSVDMIGFEFGMQKVYLAWRMASLAVIAFLVLAMPEAPTNPTRYSDLVFMHGWLVCFLLTGQTLEVAALFYVWICYPSRQIEKPGISTSLRHVWYHYRMLYPNIFSTLIMHWTFFSDHTYSVPHKHTFQNVIALYAFVHVITTGIPSHVCHVIAPAMFTLVYVIFSCVYQTQLAFDPDSLRKLFSSSPTSSQSNSPQTNQSADPNHQNSTLPKPINVKAQELITARLGERKPIYKAMDWDRWAFAMGVALTWILLTVACHVVMALVAWRRRVVFYKFREFPFQFMQSEGPDGVNSLGPRTQASYWGPQNNVAAPYHMGPGYPTQTPPGYDVERWGSQPPSPPHHMLPMQAPQWHEVQPGPQHAAMGWQTRSSPPERSDQPKPWLKRGDESPRFNSPKRSVSWAAELQTHPSYHASMGGQPKYAPPSAPKMDEGPRARFIPPRSLMEEDPRSRLAPSHPRKMDGDPRTRSTTPHSHSQINKDVASSRSPRSGIHSDFRPASAGLPKMDRDYQRRASSARSSRIKNDGNHPQ